MFLKQSADVPRSSLFFTPQEAREAERIAQRLAPAGRGDIHLGAVIYYAPNDWTVWLQGEKWTPETFRDDLRVLTVTADEVHLSWPGEDDAPPREITLRPNQSYQIATESVITSP